MSERVFAPFAGLTDIVPAALGEAVVVHGAIALAHKRLGEPQAMLILFDRVNNRIGLRAANPGLRNAYPIAKYGRHGGRLVRAYRLLAEHAIDLPETVEFPDARIDEDAVLILDLRTARISNRYLAASKSINLRHTAS